MARMHYAEALADAIHASLAADPKVLLLWGSLFGLTPWRKLSEKIRHDFPGRIAYPPTAEIGFCGVGIGAALAGARPIVPIGTGSFAFRAWDQIQHEAAVARYMSNGQVKVPVVFHLLHGIRGGGAAQHSQSPQAMLWNCPGIEVVLPSSPTDARGLFRTAVRSDNPTVIVDHSRLMDLEGDVPDGDFAIPFGKADVKRTGNDVTIVATSYQVRTALAAADVLSRAGISAEVFDPRTLVPFDKEALLASVAKTGRLVAVDECPLNCSIASEIAAIIAEDGFGYLKAPVRRVARLNIPVPFSKPLEERVSPTVDRVVEAVRAILA